jgi:UDPglucose--hexose-1-phosphate uridylyltransferase
VAEDISVLITKNKQLKAKCMKANEMRRDYLLNRWVVIATERKKRPTDFSKPHEATKPASCPFEPGNEDKTPAAELVYLRSKNGGIKKVKDNDGFRHKNWLIRCFPNLFPAFMPPDEGVKRVKAEENPFLLDAVGAHEVIVESPRHDEHPGVARLEQLALVVDACLDRLKALSALPYVQYVSIFRNHGVDAGASLSHAHSQVIATPFVPLTLRDELKASKRFWKDNHKCAFCDIMEKEKKSPRFIWENDGFSVFAPWASVNPLEFWVLPRKHQASPLEMKREQRRDLAKTLRVCLGGLNSLLNDPPYNYGFHIMPPAETDEFYHWHIEVYPKLAIWAGFEKSTGIYINTVPPEDAAASLRETAGKEEKAIKP